MNSQGFAKISTNIEIIITLFKHLKLEDQLRLAQVSDYLGSVFEAFVLRQNYRTLTINPNEEDFVVTNETNANRLALKPGEFQEFLRFYADKVTVLTQRRGALIDVRPFRNLNSLSYRNMEVPRQQLQFIADNCPQLESLYLYCCCDEDPQFFVIGENLSVDTLLQLKRLKRLSIHNAIQVSINYRDFRQIVTKLPLEYLFLKAEIDPNEAEAHITPADAPVHLKELDIQTTFDPEAFPNSFSPYLANFKNLVKLTVKLLDLVTDEILANMAGACTNLEMLYIQFSTFENIQKFAIPPKLSELSLYYCEGLTKENLKYMLTKLKIIKFSSVNIDYAGGFEDFRISPCMQALDFAGVRTPKFKSAYDGNEKLKELTWYDEYYFFDKDQIVTDVPLEKCINLETLEMHAGFMPLKTLLQLKSLHKLIIPQSMPRLNWSYITAILKHPPLNEFLMNINSPPRDLQKASDVPVLGFATNLKFVKISEEVFGMALDFWLDLLCQNDDLKLMVNNFRRNGEFVKAVVNHKNFPRHIKKVDICCFMINCRDLRRNLDSTMQKLMDDTNHLRHEYDEDLYRLILCSK